MTFLPTLIAFLEGSKYILLFIGSYVEGPAVMITAGVLWHLGLVNFWLAYLTLLAADVSADVMWYLIGFFGARTFLTRWGYWFGVTPEIIGKVEQRFHHYHTKILIVSKLTMGFGLAVPILTVAGMLRVPFTRYLTINIVCGMVWTLALMTSGYYFGNILEQVPGNTRLVIVAGIFVIFLVAVRALSNKLSKIDW